MNRLFQRKRRLARVQVGGMVYPLYLRHRPPVGATLDLGFPVVVIESKDVAGSGMIVLAEKREHDANAALNAQL